jgi:hypothetical protein
METQGGKIGMPAAATLVLRQGKIGSVLDLLSLLENRATFHVQHS